MREAVELNKPDPNERNICSSEITIVVSKEIFFVFFLQPTLQHTKQEVSTECQSQNLFRASSHRSVELKL